MTANDRRRYPRVARLTPATLVCDNQRDAATATDVSASGGFLRTHLMLPAGSLAQVTLQSSHSSSSVARLLARVVRVAEPGSRLCPVPGLGVEWLTASSAAGTDALLDFLRETLRVPVERLDAAQAQEGESPNVAVYPLHEDLGRPGGWAGELAVPTTSTHLPVTAHQLRSMPDQREADRFWVRTEIVYTLDELPHAGMIYNLSAKGAMVATQQRLPACGTTVRCKVPLTGPYAESWIRVNARVLRHVTVSGAKGEGFVMEFQRVDEMGQPGIFHTYLEYLHRAQREGAAH